MTSAAPTMPRLLSTSGRVQVYMGTEKPHVPALELWGYTSGTANLTDDHFEHLLVCIECQTLVDEFMAVLDGLRPANPSAAA